MSYAYVTSLTTTIYWNEMLQQAMGKMQNCGMWNAEGKVRNEKKERRWYGSQIRPCDGSRYAVYHTPRVAGAAVNCIMQMWKFYACYPNFDLPFAINWKVLRNDTNKNYYCCVWRICLCCCQRLSFCGGLRLTSATSYATKHGHTGCLNTRAALR